MLHCYVIHHVGLRMDDVRGSVDSTRRPSCFTGANSEIFNPLKGRDYTLPFRSNLHFYPNVTTLRSGLCYRLPSAVCRLSVCNVGTPYSRGWTTRQYFFTTVYPGHSL